jgi:ATP-dependent RNA helicase DeaD
MIPPELHAVLGPGLASALAKKGYTELTAIQEAILAPELHGRDLRITSQTGSGKTVALGFALREQVVGDCSATDKGIARPRALVVTPTRELARQVEEELGWLYAPLGLLIITTTGGASARDERRALARGPAVVVATPGRLLDHLTRGSIDTSQVAAVVLDEADRMLDLGFRDDLKAILAHAPVGHRTHLMSATFPREVRALADSVQEDAVHVEGTRLGAANVDIDHRIHLVDSHERVNAIINLLLATPDAQTLVFGRTRADVAKFARELSQAKFSVGSLSGEMDQTARNRALAAFRKGDLRVLVATDVAARGIDVQDIAYVIHAEPPTDPDSYTHRSGRTGRAGKKGTSSVLVTLAGLRQAKSLLDRAHVSYRIEPIPSADEIRKGMDERLVTELSASDANGEPAVAIDGPTRALAERLATDPNVAQILARLLFRLRSTGPTEPRALRRIVPPPDRPRDAPAARPWAPHAKASASGPGPARAPSRNEDRARLWVPFQISWGSEHGADARRLMAIVCRRGNIRGSDVGAIRVGARSSTVEVAASVAQAFGEAALAPDPRDPRVRIRRYEAQERPAPTHATKTPPSRAHSRDSGGDGAARPARHLERASRPGARADADRPSKGGGAPLKRPR